MDRPRLKRKFKHGKKSGEIPEDALSSVGTESSVACSNKNEKSWGATLTRQAEKIRPIFSSSVVPFEKAISARSDTRLHHCRGQFQLRGKATRFPVRSFHRSVRKDGGEGRREGKGSTRSISPPFNAPRGERLLHLNFQFSARDSTNLTSRSVEERERERFIFSRVTMIFSRLR